jgi:hypothetical protein
MLEFLLELVVKLGSFFYLILNTVMYLFAVHCILNRKNLRLGYSQTPATTLDLIIIVAVPIVMTLLVYNVYHEFNTH